MKLSEARQKSENACIWDTQNHHDQEYKRVLKHVLLFGEEVEDRTGVGTVRSFAETLRLDNVGEHFPLLTLRKMSWANIVQEAVWMWNGHTNVNDLHPDCQNWWNRWAKDNGELGNIYGYQWRSQGQTLNHSGLDQMMLLLEGLYKNPQSRRHVVNMWNGFDMNRAQLPCCHGSTIQFFVDKNKVLHCQMYQRSCDIMVGLPVNIAHYALLMCWIADLSCLRAGDLHINIGDAHIYKNHLDGAVEMLHRDSYESSKVKVDENLSISDVRERNLREEHFELTGYKSGGPYLFKLNV